MGKLIDESGFEQVVLLCDIEGMELDLAQHEADLLSKHVKLIIMDIHEHQLSPEQVNEMLGILERGGFELIGNISNVIVLRNHSLAS